MKMQIVAAIPCVLMIALLAFCAGLQVASLSDVPLSSRFAIGYSWLALDVFGVLFGGALLFAVLRYVR